MILQLKSRWTFWGQSSQAWFSNHMNLLKDWNDCLQVSSFFSLTGLCFVFYFFGYFGGLSDHFTVHVQLRFGGLNLPGVGWWYEGTPGSKDVLLCRIVLPPRQHWVTTASLHLQFSEFSRPLSLVLGGPDTMTCSTWTMWRRQVGGRKLQSSLGCNNMLGCCNFISDCVG